MRYNQWKSKRFCGRSCSAVNCILSVSFSHVCKFGKLLWFADVTTFGHFSILIYVFAHFSMSSSVVGTRYVLIQNTGLHQLNETRIYRELFCSLP